MAAISYYNPLKNHTDLTTCHNFLHNFERPVSYINCNLVVPYVYIHFFLR